MSVRKSEGLVNLYNSVRTNLCKQYRSSKLNIHNLFCEKLQNKKTFSSVLNTDMKIVVVYMFAHRIKN